MTNYLSQTTAEYSQKKIQLREQKLSKINFSKEMIAWLENRIDGIHQNLKEYQFQSQAEEIQFFKNVKPDIMSKLIFEKNMLKIETMAPQVKELKLVYYQSQLNSYAIYSSINPVFYDYYRSNATEFDSVYFVRNNRSPIMDAECSYIHFDARFSTYYDYKLAKIKAWDKVIKTLDAKIQKLKTQDNKAPINILTNIRKSKLKWTASKVDYVELIYSLILSGAVNNGNCDYKELAIILGKVFNIEIEDNVHRYYSDIKARKTNPTRFLKRIALFLSKSLKV